MRVIICGGRDFIDYDFMFKKLDMIFANSKPVEIVSGKNKMEVKDDKGRVIKITGADYYGERYAEKNGIAVKPFPADWAQGRKAGPLRNEEMAKYATHCVAFWDGNSRGTKDMIDRAKAHGLPTRVILFQSPAIHH